MTFPDELSVGQFKRLGGGFPFKTIVSPVSDWHNPDIDGQNMGHESHRNGKDAKKLEQANKNMMVGGGGGGGGNRGERGI